jgi:threonine dehydratase
MSMSVTFADIQKAAKRIEGRVVTTPLLEVPLLNRAVGYRLLAKAECLQLTGSFKARGAFNNLLQLTPEQKTKGVVAFSSGNHAQGVAYAAQSLGVPAVIIMPKTAPALKISNTRAYGAEVVLYDPETESREKIGEDLSKSRGLTLIKPYDDSFTIAGQGTAGMEITSQCKALGVIPDHVIIPCGGGGLSSGISIAVKEVFPSTQMHIAEPEVFDDAIRSLKSGKREFNTKKGGTLCDALMSDSLGELTFPILKEMGVTGHVVSDEEALKAVAVAARYFKLALEPGGAAALAATLFKLQPKGKTVVVVLSGGNTDPAVQADAIGRFSDIIAA